MRLKIAKRKRRKALRLGAQIVKEEKYKAPSGRKKDGYFSVEFMYEGTTMYAADWDELLVYSAVLDCIAAFDDRMGGKNG